MRPCAETLEPEMTADEQDFLRSIIKSNQYKGTHLEVGTAAGGSLCLMLKCFAQKETPPFIVVDKMNYFHNQHQRVIDNLNAHNINHKDSVRFMISSSGDAYSLAYNEKISFDFALIDAGHKAFPVISDCRWAGLINIGGIICFHDYAERCPGVYWAVDRFMARNKNYEIIGQVDSLIAIRKARKDNKTIIHFSDYLFALIEQTRQHIKKHWRIKK